MSIKAKIEAIIYAAEEPVTLEQIFKLVKDETRQELAAQLEAIAAGSPGEAGTCPGLPRVLPAVPTPAALTESEDQAAELEEPAELNVVSIEQGSPEVSAPAETERQTAVEESQPDGAAANAPEEPRQITDAEIKAAIRSALEELIDAYSGPEHGIEVRQIAGGYRMATKPEQHDAVRAFSKSLKPPMRLTLPALETLAVIAYKQPITAPEIGEIRGVDTGGVVGTLLDRKLITTAGRKQVIGRPILYKTTKEFLLRFGLKDVNELPSVEEFEKLAAESLAGDLFTASPDALATEAAAPTEEPLAEKEDLEDLPEMNAEER
jgi:segregation and condensation protein B